MNWRIQRRYYCTNAGKCQYARDYVYSPVECRANHNKCCGTNHNGCGHELKPESAQKYRQRWLPPLLLCWALLCGISWCGYQILFPVQLVGVGFAQKQSRITQGGAQELTLTIARNTRTDASVIVNYRTEDGSAKANQDYQPKRGGLWFAPGEKSKTITIQILANGKSPEKSFLVTLANVVGTPQHSITIEPPKLDPQALGKADALVRVVSNLAMDIADQYLRGKHVNRMLNSNQLGSEMRQQFKATLSGIEENRERASKRYIQTLKDLSQIDPDAVRAAFTAWDAHLDGRDMQQQKKATTIALRHYQEIQRGNPPQPDLWAMQLSKAVPGTEKASEGVQLL